MALAKLTKKGYNVTVFFTIRMNILRIRLSIYRLELAYLMSKTCYWRKCCFVEIIDSLRLDKNRTILISQTYLIAQLKQKFEEYLYNLFCLYFDDEYISLNKRHQPTLLFLNPKILNSIFLIDWWINIIWF